VKMKRTIMLVLMLGVTKVSFGQADSIKRADLDSLYIRTIKSQLDLILSSGHKYFEVTENTSRIKDKIKIDIFKFLTDQELIDKSIKEKKTLTVYRVNHEIISSDTVDINIGTMAVSAKRAIHFNHGLRTKKASFMISCGGTNGYVPSDRYAFNKTTKTWDKIEFVKPKSLRDRTKN
jgi:hypothetical protein